MQHVDRTGNMRIHHPVGVAILAIVIAVMVGACLPDTRTISCEKMSLRCPPGFSCSADQTACIPNACGDGIVSIGEQCDDGNVIDGDGCDSNCTFTGCGNGIKTDDELCDDGNLDDNDDCVDDCMPAACGDNHVWNKSETQGDLENCDDGNTITEDCPYGESCMVCDDTCHKVPGAVPVCGDGNVQQPPEKCDDGNLMCGTCDKNCQMVASAQATGTITVVDPNNINDGNSFTLCDGINAAVTFEFDLDGVLKDRSAIKVDINSANATDIRDRILVAINSVAGGLLITAPPNLVSGRTVKLIHDRSTQNGNQIIMSTAQGLDHTDMGGGEGGDCSVNVACRSNADCISNICLPDNTCGCALNADCGTGSCNLGTMRCL